ncbi:MAG TPA: GNAT family N-acetyltransferase [Terriglobia bacterium]|nr:GNAT family N-acetyltransferase [Terriglobia bacterium]
MRRAGGVLTPEIIDIRQFDASQFLPLLQAESRVWDASLRWDYTASVRLISSCLEEKRLQGYALIYAREIKGYSFFFYEGEKGLIGNLFVEPDAGGLHQALRLLEHVIETVTAIPGINRVETQLPHFHFDELNPCFVAHQFQGYQRRFMAVSLTDWKPRGRRDMAGLDAAAQGTGTNFGDFVIVPWDRKHDHHAALMLYQTYMNHVDAVINDQYASGAGASRLIENIMHQRGCGEHLPQASQVAIHRATGKIAGVLALTSVRAHTAHIPQIAVAREFQGTGLGTAMMELSFEDLSRRGFHEVSLTVTDLNVGAVRLYERMGFENFRTFGAFVWNRLA